MYYARASMYWPVRLLAESNVCAPRVGLTSTRLMVVVEVVAVCEPSVLARPGRGRSGSVARNVLALACAADSLDAARESESADVVLALAASSKLDLAAVFDAVLSEPSANTALLAS